MKKRLMSIVELRKKHTGNILVLLAILIVFTMAIVTVNHSAKAATLGNNEATGYQEVEPSVTPMNQVVDDTENSGNSSTDKVEKELVTEASDTASGDIEKLDELRKTVVEYAIQAQSTPYLWGGNDLETGVDSSGYVQAIYREVGYTLPRTSREQASELREVSLDELKPGDLIFYGNGDDKSINHVAIYTGEQKVIHASNMRDGVKTSDYDYRPIISASRVITD